MTDLEKRQAAYQVCCERGHVSDGTIITSLPPKHKCKHCGTVYWRETVTTLHESDLPFAVESPHREPPA